jgi:N-acetyl-anhydromuramyl-L-alanine amidase AmpD
MTGLWLPNTERHPIAQLDHGVREHTKGVVLHINEGTFDGTLTWWALPDARKPKETHGVGAHIEVGDSRAAQCVPLERKAWHAGAWPNDNTIGIEHSGMHLRSRADWLTGHHHELALSANRAAWILHEWKLGHPVLGHNVWRHGDGGAAWGGHPDCPGPHFPIDVWIRLCHDAYYGHWGRHTK